MELRSFKKTIAMSKEKMTEIMAAPRARRLKAQAEVEMAELETEIITLQGQIEESFNEEGSYKNFSFKNLLGQLDKLAILERRKKQYDEVLKQLFPKEE